MVDLRADLSSPERAAQEVERALSRWHSCAIQSEERSYVAKPRPVRWSIDLSYAHALFLQHDRTRELFPSPGGTVGLTYRAGRALQLFAQMNQMVSVPDDNRDLLEPMMTTRLSFGAGLVATVGRFEPFARVGAEVGVTQSDVEMTRDVACKHFGDPPEGIAVESHPCDPARIFTVEAPAVAVGLHVGLGLRWLFASRWHAQIESQMAAYVAGDDFPISDLNFPLTLTTGVGHRF